MKNKLEKILEILHEKRADYLTHGQVFEVYEIVHSIIADLDSELESKSLLDIFLNPWNNEKSKTECAERLAKKMPKGKRAVMIHLLESAWIEGYDEGYKCNFKAAINDIKGTE